MNTFLTFLPLFLFFFADSSPSTPPAQGERVVWLEVIPNFEGERISPEAVDEVADCISNVATGYEGLTICTEGTRLKLNMSIPMKRAHDNSGSDTDWSPSLIADIKQLSRNRDEKDSQAQGVLQFLPVHPQNEQLLWQLCSEQGLDRKGQSAPSLPTDLADYQVLPLAAEDERVSDNFIIVLRPEKLEEEGLLIGRSDILLAVPNKLVKDCINVMLMQSGADKMTRITSRMQMGIDRLAIVIGGVVYCSPTVQSRLGRDFQLSSIKEAATLSKQIPTALKYSLKLVEEK